MDRNMSLNEPTPHLPDTVTWNLKSARDDLGNVRSYVVGAQLMLRALPIGDNQREAIELVLSDALDRMVDVVEYLDVVLTSEAAA